MLNGWIRLHRKLSRWEWYGDSKTLHLFIHLLLKANYKPSEWRGLRLSPGQLVTGRKQLSAETGISEQSIRTSLERLKSTSEITINSTNKFSVITISNYSLYQSELELDSQPDGQQPTNNEPATNHIQEVKAHKKEEEDSLRSSSCAEPDADSPQGEIVGILPLNDGTDFQVTEEFRDELVGLYPAADVMQEFRNMKGWLLGNPTKKKTRTGITRFITNWLSRAQNNAGRNGLRPQPFAQMPRGQAVRNHNDQVFQELMQE